MFIVTPSMSRGAVRRAGTQLVFNHSTSSGPPNRAGGLMLADAIDMTLLPE